MKRYFWYRYYAASGSFGRTKKGENRKDKQNARLTTEADFWRRMALMKTGSTVKIPMRRFLGPAPEVAAILERTIEENLRDFFENDFKIKE